MTEQNGTARRQLMISAAGVLIPVIGAILFLYMTATDANKTASGLSERVRVLEANDALHQRKIEVLCTTLREVETQFRASDQIRNTQHGNLMRTDAILWGEVFGDDYPISNAYYPTIAQENPAPCA